MVATNRLAKKIAALVLRSRLRYWDMMTFSVIRGFGPLPRPVPTSISRSVPSLESRRFPYLCVFVVTAFATFSPKLLRLFGEFRQTAFACRRTALFVSLRRRAGALQAPLATAPSHVACVTSAVGSAAAGWRPWNDFRKSFHPGPVRLKFIQD